LNLVTPSRQYSAKDLPAHLELKVRQREQGADHDPNEADLYKRGKFMTFVNVLQLTNFNRTPGTRKRIPTKEAKQRRLSLCVKF
jgi:hypothetical protein